MCTGPRSTYATTNAANRLSAFLRRNIDSRRLRLVYSGASSSKRVCRSCSVGRLSTRMRATRNVAYSARDAAGSDIMPASLVPLCRVQPQPRAQFSPSLSLSLSLSFFLCSHSASHPLSDGPRALAENTRGGCYGDERTDTTKTIRFHSPVIGSRSRSPSVHGSALLKAERVLCNELPPTIESASRRFASPGSLPPSPPPFLCSPPTGARVEIAAAKPSESRLAPRHLQPRIPPPFPLALGGFHPPVFEQRSATRLAISIRQRRSWIQGFELWIGALEAFSGEFSIFGGSFLIWIASVRWGADYKRIFQFSPM